MAWGSPAALFAGVAYAYGGFMVTWAELPTLMNVATWLPGAFLGVALVFGGRRWGVPVLALSLAMSLLAGHFQIAAYVWMATAVYAGARAIWAAADQRSPYVPALVGSVLLAGALATAQLLPTLELAGNSTRGSGQPTEAGFSGTSSGRCSPFSSSPFLLPNRLGTPAEGNHELTRVGFPYSEYCGFVGITSLLLVLVGIALAPSRHFLVLLALAVGALNVAMAGSLAQVVYFGVPGLALAGGFTRLLCVYTLPWR